MAIGLYVEAVKKDPKALLDLDKRLGGILQKCPGCGHPMLTYAVRWRQDIVECICPVHGLVLLPLCPEEGR